MSIQRPSVRPIRLDAYDAASRAPRVADWDETSYGPNTALESTQIARARSQDAVRNNPWIRRALKLLVSHLIGCGIQPRPKLADKGLRSDVLALWNDWTEEADADGTLGFYGMQALITRARYEAGEVFARFIRRPRGDFAVPLQLQLLEADLLPLGYNQPIPSIRQGIERNASGRRSAYHFYRQHPGERYVFAEPNTTLRIPADEVLHHYLPDRPGQLRGAPEGLSALHRANVLDQYESAELTRKRNKARFSGVIYKETPEDNPLTDAPANPTLDALRAQLAAVEASADYVANVPAALATAAALREQIVLEQEKKTFVDIEDGYMLQLGMSERVELFGGDTGNTGLLDFLRGQLRGIAAGWGVPYELVVGDYAETNDRIMRVILNVFYRELEFQQDHFIVQVLQPVYRQWLNAAVLIGALSIPGYFADPRAWQRCEWRPQAWNYVNPLQEAQTKILKIRNGLTSRSAIVAEEGWDAEDVDNDQAADHDRERRLGLDYGGGDPAPDSDATATEKPT
ncbi:MAG TPA: phage portal protein [Candidatus Competibacteraceae bacterium]|nr:phage portal protein [Candidatus Competibacteraceae bacterium]